MNRQTKTHLISLPARGACGTHLLHGGAVGAALAGCGALVLQGALQYGTRGAAADRGAVGAGAVSAAVQYEGLAVRVVVLTEDARLVGSVVWKLGNIFNVK